MSVTPVPTSPAPDPAHDPLLRIEQTSALTGVAPGTLRYWASRGEGPKSFTLGRRRVWRKSDVLAWIQANESATSTGGIA
ncbi:helix-turn-helix transcriptional regulator [Tsukamurella soli]|uniref:Helix-turn-helix domain-containing protein n=1 Tax=Tsukamurella soli TaxID=644556 RepID=A0ABP8J855_9ACTN